MRHDPKRLHASWLAYQAKLEAATADIAAQIKDLQEKQKIAVTQIFQAHRTFSDGLIFSARARCKCGSGLALPEGKTSSSFTCAKALKAAMAGDKDFPHKDHESFPFLFYEIKDETQPSAEGETTRDEPVEILTTLPGAGAGAGAGQTPG